MWGVAVAMVVLLSGCGKPTHESVIKDLMGQMRKLTDVLKSVKSEASAREAAPKMQAIVKEMQELRKKGDALGRPTKEQEAAMEMKYGEELKKVTGEMAEEVMRVWVNPTLAGPLGEAIREFEKIK